MKASTSAGEGLFVLDFFAIRTTREGGQWASTAAGARPAAGRAAKRTPRVVGGGGRSRGRASRGAASCNAATPTTPPARGGPLRPPRASAGRPMGAVAVPGRQRGRGRRGRAASAACAPCGSQKAGRLGRKVPAQSRRHRTSSTRDHLLSAATQPPGVCLARSVPSVGLGPLRVVAGPAEETAHVASPAPADGHPHGAGDLLDVLPPDSVQRHRGATGRAGVTRLGFSAAGWA